METVVVGIVAKSFTRKNLMKLSNWEEWHAANHKQLDAHYDSGTIGKAVPRPRHDVPQPLALFCIQWACLVKPNGTRKARACVDGSKRSAPWLRTGANILQLCGIAMCLLVHCRMCELRIPHLFWGCQQCLSASTSTIL